MRLASYFKLTIRQIQRSRGIVLRALLCWAIGCLVLINDEVNSYDKRFQLRGQQLPVNPDIALITLSPADITGVYRFRPDHFGPLREIMDVTDSFYWDPRLWKDFLEQVLKQNPKKIGVSLFFNDNLSAGSISTKLFSDPKIVWGTNTVSSDRMNLPLFAKNDLSNVGSIPLLRDEDGIIRRFVPLASDDSLHLIERLAGVSIEKGKSKFINFKHHGNQFKTYTVRQILNEEIPNNAFTGKYVLIGSENSTLGQYLTPLGSQLRHELHATLLENTLNRTWIYRANYSFYALGLFLLMLLSVFIITHFPQSVAFVLLLMIGTLSASLSAWIFDSIYIWTPVLSATIQLIATWTIFLGYQANKIERMNWDLQRERKYLADLEQLKNNFVSLISHDLKTPIAKIQAIVDRLILQDSDGKFSTDLKSLRLSSEELNKYIQSILKVLRVESRDFQVNKEVGDINETILDAIQQLKPLAAEKNIQIIDNLEPLFSIEVDFTLMREVMINLIENAIKYSDTGKTIKISSQEIKEKVWIEISDQGQGIAPDELNHVWGKFVRGKDQEMKTKGTGLGLYLVKYFIELHGGEVFIESKLKQGTKISFNLPLESTDSSTPQEQNI